MHPTTTRETLLLWAEVAGLVLVSLALHAVLVLGVGLLTLFAGLALGLLGTTVLLLATANAQS